VHRQLAVLVMMILERMPAWAQSPGARSGGADQDMLERVQQVEKRVAELETQDSRSARSCCGKSPRTFLLTKSQKRRRRAGAWAMHQHEPTESQATTRQLVVLAIHHCRFGGLAT